MPHLIRRLLPALLLACAGLVLVPSSAQACTCQVPKIGQAAKQGDVVLTGAMLGQQRSGNRNELALEVERIYKGEVGSDPVEVVSPTDSCGLKLAEGQTYLVFAVDGRQGLVSEECYGTVRATKRAVAAVEKALGPGEKFRAEPVEPPPPVFTRVLDTQPPEFTRAAAPGAAMALVGLLGWALVRRRS